MGSITVFLLIWGVWLITPVLFDGIDNLSRLITVWANRQDAEVDSVDDAELPSVCIIVPAHNEVAVIDRCLNSIKAQDYPAHLLEIIVVDDGSTDGTSDRVEQHVNGSHAPAGDTLLRGERITVGDYSGAVTHIRQSKRGKAAALNAGIAASDSEIVINIDSDVVLDPHTIRAIASKFVNEPDLGALTGNVEIDWDLIEARDDDGHVIVDEDGFIVPRTLTWGERYIASSQFLEYLSSFSLGRRAQAVYNTMYTLAGACSAFRRSTLGTGISYSSTTVSEDTCLTFQLHSKDIRVGFAKDARVYLEPAIKWDDLYAQRVRWTRGQLEVCGLNDEIVGRGRRSFGRLTIPKMLLFDHTLAFPRLIWAPLLLTFPMIGYSYSIIVFALVMMYVFYLAMEILNALSVHSISDEQTRERIEKSGWTLLFLPVYRFIVFHFRFSGFLATLKEEQKWTVAGPIDGVRADMRNLGLQSVRVAGGLIGWAAPLSARLARSVLALVGSLVLVILIIAERIGSDWLRKP